jgi:hypothetical protein
MQTENNNQIEKFRQIMEQPGRRMKTNGNNLIEKYNKS